METSTIAAIASGMSASGIGIVRISGPRAMEVASNVFVPSRAMRVGACNVGSYESHTVHYGFICDGETVVDEVMLLVMKSPRTFTREDVVEIDCHGGIVVTRRILSLLLANGATLAAPGEFTKRAFLNGRIDLTQAEAVGGIISAKNELFLKNSVKQLRGDVKEGIQEIRNEILHEIAEIEAALDQPEYISLDGFRERLSERTGKQIERLAQLLTTAENGRRMREGIKTVIIGKPNAGKSSLMNALLGQERAIVTDIAGTTRDTLCEEINLDGITLLVTDTAGLRETEDAVERIGVSMARREAEEADLILYVSDSTVPLDENDYEIIRMYGDRAMLVLQNKSDLETVTTEEMLREAFVKEGKCADIMAISAKTKDGLVLLEKRICEMFFAGVLAEDDQVIVTSERQKQELAEAKRCLEEVRKSISMDMPEDFYTIDLTGAYEALGRILGEHMDEDIINRIFSEFCLGK